MAQKNILIIEDEKEIREGIRLLLSNDEYIFEEAENGEQGLKMITEDLDLVILDVMMPGMDGITVCKEIRKNSTVPILFLTARALEVDKLIGLQSGADDYLTKPFSYMELNARIRSMLRRYCLYRGREEKGTGAATGSDYIELDHFKISKSHNEVLIRGKEANLTETEYQLLLYLMQRPNRSQPTKVLYEEIWQEPYFYGANSNIMVHIRNLRTKVEDNPQKPVHIITVWGKGYQFRKRDIL